LLFYNPKVSKTTVLVGKRLSGTEKKRETTLIHFPTDIGMVFIETIIIGLIGLSGIC
jgi:hypothetical protein